MTAKKKTSSEFDRRNFIRTAAGATAAASGQRERTPVQRYARRPPPALCISN